MIKRKYLRTGDIIVFRDQSRYWLNSNQAIARFNEREENVIKVIRQISVKSPTFIGFVEDKGQLKIAFWLTDNAKYATTKYVKSEKKSGIYNVVIWEKSIK